MTQRLQPDALAYFAHDAAGNRTMMQDGSGATYYAYDAINRLTEVLTHLFGGEDMSQRNVFYYDQASNLSCVRDPDLGLTYYEYDLLDRVTSIKNPFGEVTYYEYTPGGQVKQKILGNGTISYYSYDAARRVSRIQHVKSDLTEIATLDYEYDRVGNPTKITREDGSATYYSYDNIYQLTGELQVDDEEAVEYAFEYDYDGAHNRTLKVVDGVATYYTYNAANELLTESTEGETTYYHYDGCGNTVAKQEASGTTYYQYNTENLMTRIDFAAGGSSYYDYDADSKRVSQRTADGFRQFVYQGPDMLKLQLERDESEETVAHYTMGAGLEAMRREASSFYHYNHLGTTLALTGADEAVTDTYRHDAWGVLLASTGSTVNPHTYVGRERYYRMPNASMYHLGFRDYAQGLGRFTTVDPMRWEENWWVYVSNRSVVASDAAGLIGVGAGPAWPLACIPAAFCLGSAFYNWWKCRDECEGPLMECTLPPCPTEKQRGLYSRCLALLLEIIREQERCKDQCLDDIFGDWRMGFCYEAFFACVGALIGGTPSPIKYPIVKPPKGTGWPIWRRPWPWWKKWWV